MTTQYFHFSLGPVQSFIAQARRTRDFWAGSFLLSWLSAVAMKAVLAQDNNNKIIFPEADKDYLLWLEGTITANHPPEHGSVPSRFKALVNDDFKPENVVNAVNQAWQALADKVYQGDLANTGVKTQKIWNGQVAAFWEMNWVITKDIDDSSALDVRKNWRSYLPPDEAGVKCMMMDGWQELSGADRPNAEALKMFWKTLRDEGNKGMKTDLRPNEYLCAIGFIKRRFVRYFEAVNVADMPNGWTLTGWQVKAGRPSVAYMAAVHWLEAVLKEAAKNEGVSYQLRRFRYKAFRLTKGQYNEWDSQIDCLKPYAKHRKWLALDGNVFFQSALENANIYEDQTQAQQVLKELKALQKLMPGLQPATPFYAVLMMDGDSLGKQMSDPDKQRTITQGLKNFTDGVPKLVAENNGFLIYAGGDDVLAVLPLEDALPCALAIREKYECVFVGLNKLKAEENRVSTSISAAIVFAPVKMPLIKVLKEAHDLLDKVAKDEYGRDSLAVSVWKPGGRVLQWARPWNKAITDDGRQLILERLAKDFADDDKDGRLSNKFLYKIRERFELLNPPPDKGKKPPDDDAVFFLKGTQAVKLMAAEYISSGLCEKKFKLPSEQLAHAESVVTPLLAQCRPAYRKLDETDKCFFVDSNYVRVDAALLVRFLAQKGVNS